MRLLAALLAAGCCAALTACGGGSSSPATSNATPATAPSTSAPAPTSTTAASTAATAAPAGCHTVAAARAHPEREHEKQPTTPLDPAKTWTVTLVTNCGTIRIALDVKDSPKTSAAFAGLVRLGFFDGLSFHRIASQPDGTPFVIQGGDPAGTGEGGPGYTVVEAPPSTLHYTPGVVAMAKTGTDPSGASGSQFFIVDGPDEGLPAEYALLGHVSAGMSTVTRIGKVPTNDAQQPLSPVVIAKATLSSG